MTSTGSLRRSSGTISPQSGYVGDAAAKRTSSGSKTKPQRASLDENPKGEDVFKQSRNEALQDLTTTLHNRGLDGFKPESPVKPATAAPKPSRPKKVARQAVRFEEGELLPYIKSLTLDNFLRPILGTKPTPDQGDVLMATHKLVLDLHDRASHTQRTPGSKNTVGSGSSSGTLRDTASLELDSFQHGHRNNVSVRHQNIRDDLGLVTIRTLYLPEPIVKSFVLSRDQHGTEHVFGFDHVRGTKTSRPPEWLLDDLRPDDLRSDYQPVIRNTSAPNPNSSHHPLPTPALSPAPSHHSIPAPAIPHKETLSPAKRLGLFCLNLMRR